MNSVEIILKELNTLAMNISDDEINRMVGFLKDKSRIFFAGAGRSGCIVRAFANRMMHLGFTCFVVGDITCQPIKEGDVLFIISGSGKTSSLVTMANKAKELNASVVTITLNKEGTISKLSKQAIILPGNTRLSNDSGFESIQPIGSTFEQLAWITCDGLICQLREELGQSNEDLIQHHANLE